MAGRYVLQQDVVEVVVKKLKGDARKVIDNDIMVKAQEQMRLMEIKANRKLSPIDSKEVRAAILLDYVAREEKGIRLDHKSLLQALGINGKNKAKFTQLHGMIGNYRGPEPAKLPSTDGPTRRSQSETHLQQQQHQPSLPQESFIPRLAIRLSSLIPDPNGFAFKAKNLISDIQEFVHTLEMPRRADQLTDIQRFQASYEAACLYHVVARTQTKKLSRMSKPKQKQGSATAKELEELHRPLEVEDILKACPNFSAKDFKEVCKHVEGMVIQIDAAKEEASKQRKAASRKREPTAKQGKKRNRSSDKSNQDRKQEQESKTLARGEGPAEHRKSGVKARMRDSVEMYIPSLHEWREQVLAEACQAARESLAAARSTDKNIDESAVLAFAADAELKRHGLLT